MSSFRKAMLAMVCSVLLVSTSAVMAQESELYGDWPVQNQTRNIPAGTVNDPGSSLIYIMDTGVNVREAVGHGNIDGYIAVLAVSDYSADGLAEQPFGLGGTRSIYQEAADPLDAEVDSSLINTNFIAITNTHPTAAVTVHFRYFNDECIDVLDFLVLLTCNDTLIFNPFDFVIPGTEFNAKNRIFGPAVGLFTPITANQFASGRFLIFATAAGTSHEVPPNVDVGMRIQDDNAEYRFPAEFDNQIDKNSVCLNLHDHMYFGDINGLNQNNLHVFNSSAVVFNYLIGKWTTAVPFGGVFQAHGMNAWARPAVDLRDDDSDASSHRNQPDGDGPPLVGDQAHGGSDFIILTGNETVSAANSNGGPGSSLDTVQVNSFYLRNEVHGGDTAANVSDVDAEIDDGDDDFDSWYGALMTAGLFGGNSNFFNFLSAGDDYNGSRHSGDAAVGGIRDRSYNLNGTTTYYVLQIYDWDENLFDLEPGTPINISPPPFNAPTAILKIVVECLRVWVTDIKDPSTEVDDLALSDFDLISNLIADHLEGDPDGRDLSLGTIRFVRDNNGFRSDGAAVVFGTQAARDNTFDSAGRLSFLTIAQHLLRFDGFGAASWLSSAASLRGVSDTGDPQCNGMCPDPLPDPLPDP